ncbi:RsfA family transcriptional regulator [Ectobacillus sp. JY-23]|uniref:RsfA family transcriptional regulator n=1 Tax=Ectobacillus sp. JY-23 TaxID=2933872 RepID=UPI001FF11234|nr:RsfA family transcriptional regulator [Ectobacillus sp. JY-23]UOY93741.1 RsfA family transcriptional regulator [Ectobacillus sp. JY-23]
MATTRQDAWTEDEDLLLAEVVLRHIRENGTQLSAFKEVGRSLSRTPAACGFRWNSTVRKQYKEQIDEAKSQRKGTAAEEVIVTERRSLTLADVIAFLQNYQPEQELSSGLFQRIQQLEAKAERLEKEKQELSKQLSVYEQEYKTLFAYLDQRRSVVSPDKSESIQLLRSRDTLEKVEK